MVKVDLRYELNPKYDMDAFGAWIRKSSDLLQQQPGMLEFRGNRCVFGTSKIRSCALWRSRPEWVSFADSPAWQTMESELKTFASQLSVEVSPTTAPPGSGLNAAH